MISCRDWGEGEGGRREGGRGRRGGREGGGGREEEEEEEGRREGGRSEGEGGEGRREGGREEGRGGKKGGGREGERVKGVFKRGVHDSLTYNYMHTFMNIISGNLASPVSIIPYSTFSPNKNILHLNMNTE